MKIVLVNPLGKELSDPEVHMSVLYLATHLHRCGHNVKVIDAQIHDAENLLMREAKDAGLVGFSVMTTQVSHALKLSDMLKGMNPEMPICWGGAHPTLFPEQTIKDNSVDFVIRGEGELSIDELAKSLDGKVKQESIDGLVYMKDGQIKMNNIRPHVNLDDFSPPEWDLIDFGRYVHDFIIGSDNYGKSLPIHSGRGCVYRCSFCINTFLSKKWRPLSAEKTLEEIKTLKERYGINYVKFVDENFFLDKKRVVQISEGILKEGMELKWHATTRVDNLLNRFSDDEMKNIRRSGFEVAAMGIESGSQRVLDILKKDITIQKTLEAVKLCRKFDIKPICSFMIGIPGETREDMEKTIDLIVKIRKISPNVLIIGPQVFRPYPGAELYDSIKGMFNEPKTLREWAETDMLSGYTTPEHLPWIKDLDFVRMVSFYVNASQPLHGSFARKAVQMPFKKAAEMRLSRRMFRLPIDKIVYEAIESKAKRNIE